MGLTISSFKKAGASKKELRQQKKAAKQKQQQPKEAATAIEATPAKASPITFGPRPTLNITPTTTLTPPAPKFQSAKKEEEEPQQSTPILRMEPPAVNKEVESEKGRGFALESHMDNGTILWTKIITPHPTSGEWISILLYKPTRLIPKFAEVTFSFTNYNSRGKNRLAAKDVVVVNENTPLKAAMDYLFNPDTHSEVRELKEVFLHQLASSYLTQTHVGANVGEQMKNLLKSLGLTMVVGSMGDTRLVGV